MIPNVFEGVVRDPKVSKGAMLGAMLHVSEDEDAPTCPDVFIEEATFGTNPGGVSVVTSLKSKQTRYRKASQSTAQPSVVYLLRSRGKSPEKKTFSNQTLKAQNK